MWLDGKGADAFAHIHLIGALELPNGGGGRVLDVHGVAVRHLYPIQTSLLSNVGAPD